jgi:ABC-type sugar transport system substrate-binding protein
MRSTEYRRRRVRGYFAFATLTAAALLIGSFSAQGAVSRKNSAAAGPLAGKKVLVIPYWLDNFGIAYSTWLGRDLKALGASTTTINANAVASRQLNAISSALASRAYNALIWEPIDETAAGTTVKSLQAAKIAQIVFQGVPQGKWSAPLVELDEQNSLTAAAVIAAKYIKAHPALGDRPLAAFMGVYPQNSICVTRMKSFLRGLQSVSPNAKVVYFGAATNQAAATTKMTDFINTHTKFNVTDGCGSASTLGVVAALKSAGMANAVNKAPEKVFIMTQDGSPPELQYLWDKNSAVMVSSLLPARTGADRTTALLADVISGKVPLTSTKTVFFGWEPLTPNCAKYRAEVLKQFAGVANFNVPKCSFTYTGPVTAG